MRHKFLTSNQAAARFAGQADRDPVQVYHACASFVDREGGRKATNAAAVRSFWADLDCGPGKAYAAAAAALVALKTFCRGLDVPIPLIVSSGRGLHVYWPMSADMRPGEWLALATMLKAAMARQGLVADPTRTLDLSSVLRPPGTTHRKGAPTPVTLLRDCEQMPLAAFRGALEAYLGFAVEEPELDALGARPGHIQGAADNSDLGGPTEYPPSFADRIADNCAVIGMIRDTRGVTDQGTWYHSHQLLNKCVDGWDYAHEWSKGDPRYSHAEVERNRARLDGRGPTLCSKFADLQPALCGACPHFGKIKSPISLGVEPAPLRATTELPRSANPFGTPDPADKPPPKLPFPYSWRQLTTFPREQLCIEKPKEKDTDPPSYTPISNTFFYCVERLDAGQAGASVEIEMVTRNDGRRRFTLDTSIISKGGDALFGALGKNEIMALPGRKPNLEAYLSAWVDTMAKDRDAILCREHFGWFGTTFLSGHTLLKPEGVTLTGVLSGDAAPLAAALTPVGELSEWTHVIDRAYNAPGQEAFQFMVLSSFAAPLFSLFKELGGVTVYAHSEGTGVGKTTAQRAGLSAWGNWQELQLSENKVTDNMFWGLMGIYHNLPVMFDELTNMTSNKASEIIFSISSGRAKQRMNSGGRRHNNNSNWSTVVLASGNTLLSDKISQHRGNGEAELSRLFEFGVQASDHLTPNEAGKLFPKLLDNYGHAGLAYMRYVVDNYDSVVSMLFKIREAVNEEAGINAGERYWSALFAAVLTAQLVCRKLGLLAFPVAPVKTWMLDNLSKNRQTRVDSTSDPLELFGKMLTDLGSGVLVTAGEGDLRRGIVARVEGPDPRGQLTGRGIIPLDASEEPMLALSVSSIKQWCNKHSVSSRAMLDALVAARYADAEVVKYALGRGTMKYASITSQVRCWILHPEKMGLDVAQISNVYQLNTAGRKANVQLVR